MIKTFCSVLLIVVIAATLPITSAQTPDIKVTLRGTGCPPVVMNRFGPSILVEAGLQPSQGSQVFHR